MHELSRGVEAGEIAACGHWGHRHSDLHPAPGLEGVDHRGQPPGLARGVECWFQTWKPFGVLGDGSDVCMAHHLLGGRGTDRLAEPPQVGRAPGGPARIPHIRPQQNRFAPKLGGFESADGICTGPAQVTNGVVLHPGDVDRGQVTRAPQPGQFDGISPVGCDPIPGLCGEQGGSDNPTDRAFLSARALEPIATRPCFRDKDQMLAFGRHVPDELVDIALARPNGAEGANRSVVF